MITYRPLWDTMKHKNISTYKLIQQGFSRFQIHRLKHDEPITTVTLDRLCTLLDCTPVDILEYTPDADKT